MKISLNMDTKTKVLLTVECRQMRNPRVQRSRLDETLGSASWILQENKQPQFNDDGTVTTSSVWGRVFGKRKTRIEIEKQIENMIKRAMEYADIEDFTSQVELNDISQPIDEFQHSPVLLSDD